jgi:hypothetical protein
MKAQDYEWDIAISFLSNPDEKLAEELAERLSPRFRVFVYSQQQHLVVGTHTDEVFPEIFREKARVVVILCRDEWGKKGGTMHEMHAIRDRSNEEGHEWYLPVKMEREARMPAFVPDTYIYLNFLKYGLHTLISTIEHKVQKMGGEAREESLEEMLLRTKRNRDVKTKKEEFFRSGEGHKKMQSEIDRFQEECLKVINFLMRPEFDIDIGHCHKKNSLVGCFSRFFSIRFFIGRNDIDGFTSFINIEMLNTEGSMSLYRDLGRFIPGFPKHQVITEEYFGFDMKESSDELFWRSSNPGSPLYTSEQLANHWFRLFAEYAIGERKVKGL